jgi:hypothetical protein
MPKRPFPDSTLITTPDWLALDLVKKLKDPYKARLQTVYNFIKPLAAIRPLGNEEFTDHDLAHSARIVARIGKLLPAGAKLNQPELYILLLAALLHDFGMWVARSEARRWLEDEEFLAYCRQHQRQEFDLVQRMLPSESRRWMGELGLQRLAAAFARVHHPERLAALLLGEAGDAHRLALQLFVDKAFLRAVALVSEAHGWERDRVLEGDDLEPVEIGGILVNLRYLAALLRLGDLLDLGEGRVSSLLWAYLRPLNPLSEAHWRKEKTLQVVRCEPDLIKIAGTFDVDADGIVAADAYALACDWLRWLQDEIKGCALLLPSRMEPKLRKRCVFGDLKLDSEGVRARGLVLGGELSFDLDRDRIITLLGEEIYTQGCVFVRELLQNAMDATRVQMVRDRDQVPTLAHLPRDAPWLWPVEITGRDDYAIEVTSRAEVADGINYVVFSIRDRGIGMNPRQIKDYFLQVGKSYYTTTQFRQEYSHPPISRFGIGFLSCLMVADRIEVTTRARDEAAGLRLRLNSPSTQFTITKAPEAEPGTTVTLWIDWAKPRPEGWARPPLSVIGTPQPPPLDPGDPGSPFSLAVTSWGLWPEMPVIVSGFRWGPRTIHNTVYRFGLAPGRSGDQKNRPGTQWFPLRARSLQDRVIAEGGMTLLTLGNLPIIETDPYSERWRAAPVQTLRGILVDHNINYMASYINSSVIYLNYYLNPRNWLSAGRAVRGSGFADMTSKILGESIKKIIEQTINGLGARDPAASFYWRYLFQGDRELSSLFPPWLPYRTRTESGWGPAQELTSNLIARHGRVLLVPPGLAIEGPWDLDVPCVGLTGQGTERWRKHLIENIDELPLVSLDGRCTAILGPVGASMEGLTPLREKATRIFGRTAVWKDDRFPRRLMQAHWFDSTDYFERYLPPYDRSGDLWEELGFGPAWLSMDPGKSRTVAAARKLLMDLPPIEYPGEPLVIALDDDFSDWT